MSALALILSTATAARVGALDPDAETAIAAVIAAGGTLSGAQQAACDTFIRGLKAESMWSKFAGLYLLVGGTAGAHEINWKSPGSFNITWNNDPTHDANGVTGDGATTYGEQDMATATACPQNDAHIAVYCRTAAPTGTLLGALDTGTSDSVELSCSASNVNGKVNDTTYLAAAGALNAFYLLSRTASNARFIQRNSTQTTSTTASTGVPVSKIKLLARDQDGGVNNFTDANLAFASMGNSLTTAQGLAFNTLVEALQIAFNRNV